MIQDLVRFSRSYRSYDESRRITQGELLEFVECARLTPCSVNIQPFQYYLACMPEVVSIIQPLTTWAAALPDRHLPDKGHCPTAFIIICQDTSKYPFVSRFQKEVGIVAQTMLLAAAEKGLGGCMIGSFKAEELKNALNFPNALAPLLILALGKPSERIILTDLPADGDPCYYRDEYDFHYVPKRRLKDIIIFPE